MKQVVARHVVTAAKIRRRMSQSSNRVSPLTQSFGTDPRQSSAVVQIVPASGPAACKALVTRRSSAPLNEASPGVAALSLREITCCLLTLLSAYSYFVDLAASLALKSAVFAATSALPFSTSAASISGFGVASACSIPRIHLTP